MLSICLLCLCAINFGQSIGFTNPIIVGGLILSVLFLIIFIKVEKIKLKLNVGYKYI